MYLVAIAWMYVVLMMTVAEATSSTGSLLGALITFIFYGLLPLSIVLYLLNTPARRRSQRAARPSPVGEDGADPGSVAGSADPDQRGHAAGGAITSIGKEP
jgi:membrane protein implicated in regulation of membrane protease activity